MCLRRDDRPRSSEIRIYLKYYHGIYYADKSRSVGGDAPYVI